MNRSAVANRQAVKEALIDLLSDGNPKAYKHNASGTPAATGYAHGPGGLLTYPGVDPMVFSTIQGAYGGILSELPTKSSLFTNPLYEVVTGVQAQSGNNKNAVCDNAPVAGLMKAGMHTAPFGRYELATREMELNRMGQRNNRGDPLDLRLMNNPISGSIFDTSLGDGMSRTLTNEYEKALFERAVAFHRLLSRQIWTGTSASNSAGGGYKELNGFERLIATGYVDAETNTSLPSLDPLVIQGNYAPVQGAGATATTIANVVNMFATMARYLRSKAVRSGIDPVRWVIAMKEELFWALSSVWPCAYYLGGCTVSTSAGQQVTINARDSVDLRDQMRAGKFLIIDGLKYDVTFDDGITEETNTTFVGVPSTCFASDAYFIPMSVSGGIAVTMLEYFDQANADISDVLGTGLVLGRSTAGGAFLEWPRQTNQCFVLQAKIEPRLVLRTPWLAGRIRRIVYCPLVHTDSPFPDDPYHKNGGLTTRTGPSFWGD